MPTNTFEIIANHHILKHLPKIEREKFDLQIRVLEKQLNVEVYELFGLANEEIWMVER